jgi:hypothetical protein
MSPELLVFGVIVACAVGALGGYHFGKDPNAVAEVRAEAAKVQATLQNALSSAHASIAKLVDQVEHKTPPAVTAPPAETPPAPGPVAAAAAAGVSPAASPAWTLGTSYPSLAALLADASPRTDRMIRLNDAPVAGFTLGNPVDFYTWPDGSVAQTKPGAAA